MAGRVASEQQLTAFMRNTEDPDMLARNRIHTGSGAKEYGFEGALVGGVTVYGWCAPTILEAAGDRWLSDGWIDVRFRRPVYPQDELTIRATETEPEVFTLEVIKGGEELCIVGTFGCGTASWLGELSALPQRPADPVPNPKPELHLESAPKGEDIKTLGIDFSPAVVGKVAREDLRSTDPRFTGEGETLVHPSLLARNMIALLAHSYEYGKPAIHTRSQIQNFAEAKADAAYTLSGRFINAWERGGHHYAETDGSLYTPSGTEVARMRHTNIFRVARRSSGA